MDVNCTGAGFTSGKRGVFETGSHCLTLLESYTYIPERTGDAGSSQNAYVPGAGWPFLLKGAKQRWRGARARQKRLRRENGECWVLHVTQRAGWARGSGR